MDYRNCIFYEEYHCNLCDCADSKYRTKNVEEDNDEISKSE